MYHDPSVQERKHHLFTLSARSEGAVCEAARKLARHLEQKPEQPLGDLAYTLNIGRKKFNHRLALVAATREELQALCLQAAEQPSLHCRQVTGQGAPAVTFFCPGDGQARTGMGQELYESSSVFRRAVDECAALLEPQYPVPFLHYLFDPQFDQELAQKPLCSTAQFVVEYATACLWKSWGIEPARGIGQGRGELTAACLSGSLTLVEALRMAEEPPSESAHHDVLPQPVVTIGPDSNWQSLLTMLGELFTSGVEANWKAFDQDYKRRRVHAPTYPFERKSYWWQLEGRQLVQLEAAAATVEAVRTDLPTEHVVRLVWQEVFGIAEVAPDDHFLTLGGDSLMMIQVKSRLQKALGLDVPIKDMFTYPAFTDFVARVDALRRAAQGEEAGEIPPAAVREHYPLSHTQRRLWFLYKIDPQSTAYHIPLNFTVQGNVRPDVLNEALQFLINRHSALRTVFREVDGTPCQIILGKMDAGLQYEDLSEMAPADQSDFYQTVIARDQATPFDLTAGPVLRTKLFKLGADKYHLYLNQHHILTDGWSMDLFMQELADVYRSLDQGQQPQLKQPVQFVDYVQWYEREEQAGRFAKEGQYWLDTLAKPLPVLNLPTDFPRPEVQTFNGSIHRLPLSAEQIRQVREAAQREGVSLYMVLLAAYQLLLSHLSQETDILVGTPVVGRAVQELESVIGFFANSVTIRTDVSGEQTVRDLLRQVTRQSLDALEHQSYPFDRLIEQIKPERDMSRPPIFSTFFVFRNAEAAKKRTGQLLSFDIQSSAADDLGLTSSKFDLTLNIIAREQDELNVLFEYNTDLFRESSVERFAQAYGRILEAFAGQIETPLCKLKLLTDQECAIYDRLNDTEAAFPAACTIQELFYQQAHKHADRPALSDPERTLTYSELNERSNQLASLLVERGAGRERVVGVLLERGIEAVIAILAVLKSGSAYVPIDPTYPESRVQYMMADSGAEILLSNRTQVEALELQDDSRVLCLEDVPTDLPTDDLPIGVGSHDLAYMIYTSGSTGTPKGTELHHAGVANLAQWKRDRFGYNVDDTILQFASFSFDASVWEMFPALLNGAHLYLLGAAERQSVEAFADAVEQQQATTVTLPTVFFNQLSRHRGDDELSKFRSLKRIFVAGEALQGEVVRAWQRRFGDRILIVNAYGPTETTVCATVHAVDYLVADDQAAIPIGTPIANTRVYVLNAEGKLCPLQAVGELYVESVGVARGYRNQEERTAAAFIPHPFSDRPGARLYRTGDMVRLLADGNIEFIGRKDDQVKVRGHRIELGEIEECLLKHPHVKDGAVVPKRTGESNTQLIAFFTPPDAEQPDVEALRGYLAQQLPDYMVPAQIVALERMPLTPNAKIDRKQLLAIDVQIDSGSYVAPETELERTIAAVWEKCLGRAALGIHDNFFSVGGDSIISMQVVSFLLQAGIKVKVQDLFQHQTIAELARYVETNQLFADSTKQTARGPHSGDVPLAPIQRWMFSTDDIDHEYYLMPIAIDINIPVNADHLQRAIHLLVEHHDMLRATYRVEKGAVKQTLLSPQEARLDLERHDLSALDEVQMGEEIVRIEREMKQSIKFENGLLMRAALLTYSATKHRFLWVIHHLLDDVVSQHILNLDLINLYESLEAGLEPQLPSRTASYAEWVETATRHMAGEEGERALTYWRPLLQANDTPKLPIDDPEGRNRIGDRLMLKVEIEEARTAKLLTCVTEAHGTSIKEVMMTAVLRAAAKWSGHETIGLSVEGHGREALGDDDGLDLTRTVGWFTSIYPFYAKIGADQPIGETIRRVHDGLTEIPHGGASFNMLRYLSDDASVRELFDAFHMPQISYNFMGQPGHAQQNAHKWTAGKQLVWNNSPDSERPFEVQIVGVIAAGKLVVSFDFSKQRYRTETAEALTRLFQAEIEAITR